MHAYRTLARPAPEQLHKEKGSRFISYAFPLENEAEVKPILEQLRKTHVGAVHFCYAWQLGTTNMAYRANDDGEPSHSAGAPIYGQIQSFGLTNILVVVVRYFGGVKLGVGGLIAAYRTSAQMALTHGEIVEREIRAGFTIHTTYAQLSRVMWVVRENRADITSQSMELECVLEVMVPMRQAASFEEGIRLIIGTTLDRH